MLCIISLLIFDGCKKGSQDPAISLRSRNSRICGQWQLASVDGKTLNSNYATTYSFSGTDYTVTTPNYTTTYKSYDLQMKISKDNTIQITEVYSSLSGTSYSTTLNLYWNWIDCEKKTMIYLPLTSFAISNSREWDLVKLSHKQIILNYKRSETDNSASYSTDVTLTFNLVK